MLPVNRGSGKSGSGKSGPGKSGSDCISYDLKEKYLCRGRGKRYIQSDPDLPGPDLSEPRFTGRIKFPRYGKITAIWPRYTGHPDLPGKNLSPEHPGKSGSDCTDK
eukprot:sb/3477838/